MDMRLTTQDVERFKGGQMEIQNQGEGYLYRGEVTTIAVESNELRVNFAGLAKGEGYPPLPQKWVKDDRLDYAASLEICSAINVDPSSEDGGNRLCLQLSIVGEIVVLYPPDGSKLDPSKVEGLVLAQA
jgi:hypothetical protein